MLLRVLVKYLHSHFNWNYTTIQNNRHPNLFLIDSPESIPLSLAVSRNSLVSHPSSLNHVQEQLSYTIIPLTGSNFHRVKSSTRILFVPKPLKLVWLVCKKTEAPRTTTIWYLNLTYVDKSRHWVKFLWEFQQSNNRKSPGNTPGSSFRVKIIP